MNALDLPVPFNYNRTNLVLKLLHGTDCIFQHPEEL